MLPEFISILPVLRQKTMCSNSFAVKAISAKDDAVSFLAAFAMLVVFCVCVSLI